MINLWVSIEFMSWCLPIPNSGVWRNFSHKSAFKGIVNYNEHFIARLIPVLFLSWIWHYFLHG